MKNRMLMILAGLGLSALLAAPAAAIRAINDFRISDQVKDTVIEKYASDVSAASVDSAQQTREQEVEQIRELLRLDELNRDNTAREALRRENLEDRIRGHEDLELALEEKNVDLHLGKSLVDVHGNRVRMEEYVLRPEANQVQFLNLTMRDNRLDYINYVATFNDILPRDTRGLWRKEFGSTAPEIYLETETVKYSNLTDAVDFGIGYFEPTWVAEIQQYVLPERESSLRVNTILKWGHERPTPQSDFTFLPDAVGVREVSLEFTDLNLLAPKVRWTFNDDTYLELQRYLITEDGSIFTLRWGSLSDLINLLTNFQAFIFNSYKEQIFTATEFEGRTIDTVSQFLRLVDIFADDDRGWR